MAGSIAVTPEQLKSQAKVYSQASSLKFKMQFVKVNSMNQQISQQWKGKHFKRIWNSTINWKVMSNRWKRIID